MFTGDGAGHAEEAINFYISIFKDSKVESLFRYENQPPDKDGTLAHALFVLNGQQFVAMDSAQRHDFIFNEAVSLIVSCDTQEEIDLLLGKALCCTRSRAVRLAEGQIRPFLADHSERHERHDGKTARPSRSSASPKAFLAMKKFDLATLNAAYQGG